MKVVVDKDLCLGCGICEGLVPEVFSLENEPFAEVLLDPIPEEFWESVHQAVEDCPEGAISIEEDSAGADFVPLSDEQVIEEFADETDEENEN